MEIRAYAKLNLILKIVGRRSDGYHDLVSLFQRIDLFDRLTFLPQKSGVTLVTDKKELPGDASNLVFRAAELILKASGIREGISITLEKNIPVGAGLGGGSSDAASALIAIDRIFQLNRSPDELSAYGAKIGSDVPFFCRQTPAAWVTGRGDRVEATSPLLEGWYLLVFPRFSVSTKEAYQAWDRAKFGVKKELTKKLVHTTISGFPSGNWHAQAGALENDFERVVFPLYPVLKEIQEYLSRRGAETARLSGSGSTIFGLFLKESAAREARTAIEKDFPELWVRTARGA